MNLCKRFIERRRKRRIEKAEWVCAPCSHRYGVECREEKMWERSLGIRTDGRCQICGTWAVVHQSERAHREQQAQDALDRQQPVRSGGAS